MNNELDKMTDRMIDQLTTITPGPWKWIFVSTAGNWFLLGNDGEGPITRSGPGTPDGNLKAAAPLLLEALTEGIGVGKDEDFASDLEVLAYVIGDEYRVVAGRLEVKAKEIRAAIAAARGENDGTRT